MCKFETKKEQKMTQTRKKWLISPNTKRKYAICIRCWSDGRFRHYVIERKSPTAVLYEFLKTYNEALEYLQRNFKAGWL